MLPIATLVSKQDSILFELPSGKPNPKQRCEVDKEIRDRIFQSPAKGGNCWYNTFNYLRRRIGKDPDPKLIAQRKIEEVCSLRRKKLTNYDNRFPVTIDELYSASEYSYLEKIDLKNAEKILKTLSPDVCLDGRSSLASYVKKFIEEKKFKNLHEFLLQERFSKLIEINKKFLADLCTEDMLAYVSKVEKKLNVQKFAKAFESKKVKKLNTCELAKSIDISVMNLSAILYQLKTSFWKPSKGIDALIAELKSKGPLMILGIFGESSYKVLFQNEKTNCW